MRAYILLLISIIVFFGILIGFSMCGSAYGHSGDVGLSSAAPDKEVNHAIRFIGSRWISDSCP